MTQVGSSEIGQNFSSAVHGRSVPAAPMQFCLNIFLPDSVQSLNSHIFGGTLAFSLYTIWTIWTPTVRVDSPD